MSSHNFYSSLQPISSIQGIIDPDVFTAVPDDWLVAVSDVKGSTDAVRRGRYKDVNSVAAAVIAAIRNAVGRQEIPFVFGGDGASALIPPEFRQTVARALAGARTLAKDGFNLELRVGIVPVSEVRSQGYEVSVVKIAVAEGYNQAAFYGGGVSHAEDMLKLEGTKWHITDDVAAEADFSGFECRWGEIGSHKDETLALLVKARDDARPGIYGEVLNKLEQLYGERAMRHPINISNLRLSFAPGSQSQEVIVRSGYRSLIKSAGRAAMNLGAEVAFRLGRKWGDVYWNDYKRSLIASTDHEKFDDALRMVISSTTDQTAEIRDFLQKLHAQDQIFFGTHSTHGAIITCIVYDNTTNHIHFLDGAGGGYVQAATEMKAQMKSATHT